MNNHPDMHLDTKFQKLPPIRKWTKFPEWVWELSGTKTIRDSDGNLKEINLYASRPAENSDVLRRRAMMAQMGG